MARHRAWVRLGVRTLYLGSCQLAVSQNQPREQNLQTSKITRRPDEPRYLFYRTLLETATHQEAPTPSLSEIITSCDLQHRQDVDYQLVYVHFGPQRIGQQETSRADADFLLTTVAVV